MFDISMGEMLIVGVVALLVIGPKELPGVIRSVGRSVAKLRTMAGDFRSQFDEAMREAELHEVKQAVDDVKSTAAGFTTSTFDPIRNQIQDAVDGVKSSVSDATAVAPVSETIAAVDADARAMEAEALAPEPAPEIVPSADDGAEEPKPKAKRPRVKAKSAE
jgi:sec-independent protein translocase protein TatB